MTDILPTFRYHSDPVASGVIAPSDVTCLSCGRARGHIYGGPVYSTEDLHDQLCPWCVADGSASAKFDATFGFYPDGVSPAVAEEIGCRTPAFFSWQETEWVAHCDDACAYEGHPSVRDVREASPETVAFFSESMKPGHVDWAWWSKNYAPGGMVGIHAFRCLHCGVRLFIPDLG